MLGIGSIVSCGAVSILISIWQCHCMGIYVCPKRRVRISNFIVIYKRKSCDVRTHYLKGTTRWWILYPRRCAILGVGQIAWFRELATVRRCGTVRAVTTSAAPSYRLYRPNDNEQWHFLFFSFFKTHDIESESTHFMLLHSPVIQWYKSARKKAPIC